MGRLTLILGGARSGKSAYAQRLALQHGGRVVYVATARALDAEMESRIIIHKEERPEDWHTLELPYGTGPELELELTGVDLVLFDCLTMMVTNLLLDQAGDANEPDEEAASRAVEAGVESLLNAVRSSSPEWILVSNEVGLGLVPLYPLGRLYRDLLGRANQKMAALAAEVYWLVAGIPVPVHPFRS